MKKHLLFFDSGVGGLSILQAVEKVYGDLFQYSYLMDNLNFPYSEKSDDFLLDNLLQILTKAADELNPDIIVIACNTASTLILEQLRNKIKIPVIGVIPAIKPAIEYRERKGITGDIGVLATKATVSRPYVHQLISQYGEQIKDKIHLLGTTELVEYTECKLKHLPYHKGDLQQIFQPWLEQNSNVEIIVLACTHFSLVKEDIKLAFGDKQVFFIDACFAIARRVGILSNLISASSDIEQERQNFLDYLHSHPEAEATDKTLYTTAVLNQADFEALESFGFKTKAVLTYK